MTILNGYYSYLTTLSKGWIFLSVWFLSVPAGLYTGSASAQPSLNEHPTLVSSAFSTVSDFEAATFFTVTDIENGPGNPLSDLYYQRFVTSRQDTTGEENPSGPADSEVPDSPGDPGQADTTAPAIRYPDPNSVMLKSVMIPGWGQVVNRQAWKVPIIYGLFGGLGYALHELTKRYHGYRAAYYNLQRGADSDFRFGPTPSYIPQNVGLDQLRDARNSARNQRDTMYIIMGVAYGLNVLDSYVYAHMRTFDVSDDLSAETTIGPSVIDGLAAGFRLQIQLKPKNNSDYAKSRL